MFYLKRPCGGAISSKFGWRLKPKVGWHLIMLFLRGNITMEVQYENNHLQKLFGKEGS